MARSSGAHSSSARPADGGNNVWAYANNGGGMGDGDSVWAYANNDSGMGVDRIVRIYGLLCTVDGGGNGWLYCVCHGICGGWHGSAFCLDGAVLAGSDGRRSVNGRKHGQCDAVLC
jgi:hypothetical protein